MRAIGIFLKNTMLGIIKFSFSSLRTKLFFLFIFLLSMYFMYDILSHFNRENSINHANNIDEIYLNGDWEFYWNELISPDDFQNGSFDYCFLEVPGYWSSSHNGYSSTGFCTYKIKIKNNFNSNKLGVRIDKINSSYKLWVNGELLIEKGVVAKNVFKEIPKNATELIPLHDNSKELDIVLQVSNFNHKNGGIAQPIKIGDFLILQNEFVKEIVVGVVVFGLIFFVSIYHIILYYFHTNRVKYLYFGLFCLFISFYEFFASDDLFVFIFPQISWSISHKVEYLILYVSLPLFSQFAYSLFKNDFSKLIIKFIIFISIGLSVFVLITPPAVFSYSLVYFEIFALVSMIYIVYCIYLSYKRKRHGAILMLGAFLIVGTTMITQIIANEFAYEESEPMLVGISIFIILQAVLLGRNSSKAYYKLSLQAQELLLHRDNLSFLVRERTIEVENQKEEIAVQNEMLSAQHDLLLCKSKEISDSIEYAKYIQSAAQPADKYFKSLLPDSFVYYKPKDIVSGDFYWIKKVNEYIILACADCTGHGVPGAFMSMLGVSILNELVYNKKINQANQVLNEMRTNIKESLHQNQFDVGINDGIDMSLVVIDTKRRKLQFAGAFSSMLYFHNDEMKIIRGDRMPVGVYIKDNEVFVNHFIDYDIGSHFYLYTDGYIDQFGGVKNRKFLSVNFRNLINDIHNQSMEKQKNIIEDTMGSWMQNQPQMDDMLVVGVRLK